VSDPYPAHRHLVGSRVIPACRLALPEMVGIGVFVQLGEVLSTGSDNWVGTVSGTCHGTRVLVVRWYNLASHKNAEERIDDGHACANDAHADFNCREDGDKDKVPSRISDVDIGVEDDSKNADDRSTGSVLAFPRREQ
jgi:hypothetical protein